MVPAPSHAPQPHVYGLYNFVAVSLEPHYVLGESHFAQRELRLRDGAIVRENSCHRREFEAYDVWGSRIWLVEWYEFGKVLDY